MGAVKEFYHDEICQGLTGVPYDTDINYDEVNFQIQQRDASLGDLYVQEFPSWMTQNLK